MPLGHYRFQFTSRLAQNRHNLQNVIDYADAQRCDFVFLHAYDQDFSAEPERDHAAAAA